MPHIYIYIYINSPSTKKNTYIGKMNHLFFLNFYFVYSNNKLLVKNMY